MKKVISLLSVFAILAVSFCACTKLPEEPATTQLVKYTVVREFDDATTEPAPVKKGEETTAPSTTKQKELPPAAASEYDFVIADYYISGKSYVKINNVELYDYGLGTVDGYATVEFAGLASSDNEIRVGLRMYNAQNQTVKTSYLIAILNGADDYKEGDTANCRFSIPADLGITKIEFVDYSEIADLIEA